MGSATSFVDCVPKVELNGRRCVWLLFDRRWSSLGFMRIPNGMCAMCSRLAKEEELSNKIIIIIVQIMT